MKVGSLLISASGLPTGAAADIKLMRASQTVRDITPGTALSSLDVGDYTVVATPVTAAGNIYDPQPATQDVSIANNKQTSASITYARRMGAISVSVAGLPTGANASVTLTPPSGDPIAITASTSLTGVTPGAWRIAASAISHGGFTYQPTPTTVDTTVTPGASVTITVQYAIATGALSVALSGVPEGANAAVQVTGPNGFSRAVTGSTTITDLAPGSYTVVAADIASGGFTHRPSPNSQTVTLGASTVPAVASVVYTQLVGTLVVGVINLPGGSGDLVQVTGPSGFSRTTGVTATYTGLPAGAYAVVAAPVTNAIGTYNPSPASAQRTLAAGGRDSIGITYAIATGSLAIQVAGVPSGASAAVQVTGPGNYSKTVTATQTLVNLAPGSYTIAATNISHQGNTYAATPAQQQVTVTASEVAAGATVTYAQQVLTGQLAVTVTGLPAGTNAQITLAGGTTNQTLTGSQTVTLPAGTYTLAASNVTSGGTTWQPSPATQIVAVNQGFSTSVFVSYSAVPTGPQDDLVLEFAYLTQAVQRPDGGANLVAGRDALLRVFVTSNRANTFTPTVRARVYEGTTLLQTSTLNAPEAAVRTSVAEGILTSSWNVLVAGANVRPNMRILVDVDPGNAITESDETNNIWPRSGSAQPITVLSVPAFNVRFVPVIVGALTGNVSDANKEQFLVTLRRLFPINTVNSSVRLPFTSSATALQSNDGNGAWLTVLQEMSQLQAAEGPSSTHYYGVIKASYTSGIAGYGYVPGRAAVGWDYLPSGDGVAAHEWGHNFNRPHSPCGGAAQADPAFPYAGGAIGMYGWNSTSNTLVQPNATDIMGYCGNQWISDYVWSKVITYRQTSGIEVAASSGGAAAASVAASAAATGGTGLLVAGRISNGKVVLEPAFRVNAPPTPTSSRGSYRIEAVDRRGQVLYELAVEPQAVDHVTGSDERHFAVVLPWTARLERALATVRVRDARTLLVADSRSSATAIGAAVDSTPVLADPSDALDATGSNRARLRWNRSQYPKAMVRDVATGQIVAFVARSGDEIAVAGGRDVEVVFSDGVRSVVKRHRR